MTLVETGQPVIDEAASQEFPPELGHPEQGAHINGGPPEGPPVEIAPGETTPDDEQAPEVILDRRVAILQSEYDAPWVESAKQKAFGEIVMEFEGPLLGFVKNRIKDAAAAENVVQETFLNAYRAIDTFEQRNENSLSNLLYTIARRLTINFVRDKKTDMVALSMVGAVSTGPKSLPVTNSSNRIGIPGERLEFRQMLAVVDMLEPAWRRVMVLSGEGRSQEEIAEIEKISVGAVKSRLTRACWASHSILEKMDRVSRLPFIAPVLQEGTPENKTEAA